MSAIDAVEIPLTQVRKGDAFWHDGKLIWTAIDDADADEERGAVYIDVAIEPDGGLTTRTWDIGKTLPIVRPGAVA